MKLPLHTFVRAAIVAGLSLLVTISAQAQDSAPGVVRISKPTEAQLAAMKATPVSHSQPAEGCQVNGNCPSSYPTECDFGRCRSGCRFGYGCHKAGCWGCRSGCCGNCCSQDMVDYFRCKFGYFIPTGAGGAGVPFAGKYSRVYPQDPYYFDQRDGQAWGAQGYGVPLAVPLAPVVGHTYNYGWGTPSSRLTPVSRPAY